jgi:hypothetical protein
MKKISRSKIDLFIECSRCFYLDVVKGIKRPKSLPLTLNNAVDTLLKNEFDYYRARGTQHPIQKKFGLNVFPSNHPMIDKWRQALHHGVIYKDEELDLHIFGGIDDLWENEMGEYFVVDYKATAKSTPVIELPEWANGYKRQMEVYQWLLRKNGLKVSDTAFFVYATADNNAPDFGEKLSFSTNIIAYEGDDSWVGSILNEIHKMINEETEPSINEECEYCRFRNN